MTETASPSSLVRTGISGMVLGAGPAGPVTARIFRPEGTRVFLAADEYVEWLVAFRAMCLGAHLSVITEDHRPWLSFVDVVRSCGGTIDMLSSHANIPGQGRPYRPSLIIDSMGALTQQHPLGGWQALVSVASAEANKSVSDMRNSHLSIIADLSGKTGENLRRAYALTPNQINASQTRESSDVVLAGLRRIMKISVMPSPTEHRLLFAG